MRVNDAAAFGRQIGNVVLDCRQYFGHVGTGAESWRSKFGVNGRSDTVGVQRAQTVVFQAANLALQKARFGAALFGNVSKNVRRFLPFLRARAGSQKAWFAFSGSGCLLRGLSCRRNDGLTR